MSGAWLTDPQIWAALPALTALEIILGIDNLVMVALLAARLPPRRAALARHCGLAMALAGRLALLASLAWIVTLTAPLFGAFGHRFSWRDLILIGGGLFLLYSGTREIHGHIEGRSSARPASAGSFAGIVVRIAALDLVFSLDSIITAVGMANRLSIMACAVILAMAVMFAAAAPVAGFIERHPTIKTLAFSFLLLIGMTLLADGFGKHVPRGYVYAAIGFSIAVEALNQLAAQRSRRPAAREGARAADEESRLPR